jgi:hypothetical protein
VREPDEFIVTLIVLPSFISVSTVLVQPAESRTAIVYLPAVKLVKVVVFVVTRRKVLLLNEKE